MSALSKSDYLALQSIALRHPELPRILNYNGAAPLTVCPNCHVDDFVHIEGCPLLPKRRPS